MRHQSLASLIFSFLVGLGMFVCSSTAFAQASHDSGRLLYPASFFSAAQPTTAYDMVSLLPGFAFKDSDSDVRGLAGSSGNVLVDGKRVVGKHETLSAQIRRIPASQVLRIELIRSGNAAIDMLGESALANIVRDDAASSRGSLSAGSAFFSRGFQAPEIEGELSVRNRSREIGVAAAAGNTVDIEHGKGASPRFGPDGTQVRANHLTQDEGERFREIAGKFLQTLTDADLQLNASYRRENFHAHILEAELFPTTQRDRVTEFEEESESEFTGRFNWTLGAGLSMQLSALYRRTTEDGGERELSDEGTALVAQDNDASEKVIRVSARREADSFVWDGGIELVENALQSKNGLNINGEAIELPGASVRVTEQRVEPFASVTWSASSRWSLEAGLRFESSVLEQAGYSHDRRRFDFAKPRVSAAWNISAHDLVRLRAEKRVGQLDFEDFASSASLSTGSVTAGNSTLQPDHAWRTELMYERSQSSGAALGLTARYDRISELIDRIPIFGDETFDAIGNIGDGRRIELQCDLTVPFKTGLLRNATLKANLLWRDSRAIDPVSGVPRSVSEDLPWEGSLEFRKNIDSRNLHWSFEYTLPSVSREYRFDEVRTERLGEMVNLSAGWKPTPHWDMRAYANNLLNRAATRERLVYPASRASASPSYAEVRMLKVGVYAGLSITRIFGERD